jgi:hypothetical protein
MDALGEILKPTEKEFQSVMGNIKCQQQIYSGVDSCGACYCDCVCEGSCTSMCSPSACSCSCD